MKNRTEKYLSPVSYHSALNWIVYHSSVILRIYVICTYAAQQPRKSLCHPKVRIFEVISLVPFKDAAKAAAVQQVICPANPVADGGHNRIPCLFLSVSETEINRARL